MPIDTIIGDGSMVSMGQVGAQGIQGSMGPVGPVGVAGANINSHYEFHFEYERGGWWRVRKHRLYLRRADGTGNSHFSNPAYRRIQNWCYEQWGRETMFGAYLVYPEQGYVEFKSHADAVYAKLVLVE